MISPAPAPTNAARTRAERTTEELVADVDALLAAFHEAVDDQAGLLARVHPSHRADAENLLHYVVLRQRDENRLQRSLADRGLSSLGRCEPHVLASISAVRAALASRRVTDAPSVTDGFRLGRARLDANTDALLGPRPPHRVPRIMVTLPSEAAADRTLVRTLVLRGMDIARINGAHDGPDAWRAMAGHVRAAAREAGRAVLVSMDLPGPKPRTGPLVEGPRVVRVRPARDARGVPVAPGRARLVPEGAAAAPPGGLVSVPVPGEWLARLRPGRTVTAADTRGSHRALDVVAEEPAGLILEAWDTTYLETGTLLTAGDDAVAVGALPPVAQFHLLRRGDPLWLTADLDPAPPWHPGSAGQARIGCSLPEVLAAVRVGDRVLLDDGAIGATVEAVRPGRCLLRVIDAGPRGAKLRAEKGINVPDTALPVAAVGPADEEALAVAATTADMVALSFLRSEADVDLLRGRLADLGRPDLGLLLKIETAAAFERLPGILLHAMRSERVGVMIARGDLAVEVGYERLAELQEEILWLCEAAHLPVVWATEVLDRLARTGRPSRAEVTDAAMSQRAECVMLNKGEHIAEAITVLDGILRRMSRLQRKKTPLLRPLRSWSLDEPVPSSP